MKDQNAIDQEAIDSAYGDVVKSLFGSLFTNFINANSPGHKPTETEDNAVASFAKSMSMAAKARERAYAVTAGKGS